MSHSTPEYGALVARLRKEQATASGPHADRKFENENLEAMRLATLDICRICGLAADAIEALSVHSETRASLYPEMAKPVPAIEPTQDEKRYRWLNKQHNFMIYIEDEAQMRTNVRLRCGLPLDEWIDNRIKEEAERG